MNINSIGLIGYGRFGSFYANEILPRVFPEAKIRIYSSRLRDDRAEGFEKVAKSDLVIPAVPIRSMASVLKKLSPLVVKNTIVMDVCSVKSFPVKWMREFLPRKTAIIATHPMFGLSSYLNVKKNTRSLTLVIYPERIESGVYKAIRDRFLEYFRVVEMTPDQHDKKVARFQFLSHLLGGVLGRINLRRTKIDTQSGSRMHDMIDVLNNDSMELFEDMYDFNPYAKSALDKFDKAYKLIRNRLET